MANNPIQLLMAEHEVITEAGQVVSGLEKIWRKDGELYEKILRELLSFLRKYSDGFHHRKEEEVLFPALKNNQEFMPLGLLDEMEEHHQLFRDQVSNIESALDQQKYELAQAELDRYFNDLLDHIAVENDELFVIAESLFNDQDLEKIYFRCKDLDLELGEGLKQELEACLPRLKALL